MTTAASAELLAGWAVRDADRGRRNLAALASHLGADGYAELLPALGRLLPRTPDPDMALNNLERLLAQPAAREQLPALLEHRARGLDAALYLLATSQFFADTLAVNPDFLDTVRNPPRRHPAPAELLAELRAEVDAAPDDPSVLRAFRRFRHRHTLRLGINDVIRDRPLEEVTRELSRLADASLEVALDHALRTVGNRFGTPAGGDGKPAKVAALAFGKHGGEELNYSSDIDLMFVYDADGETTGRRSAVGNAEFFARVVSEVVRLLSSLTDRGFAYRVDLRLRPEGGRAPLARSLASTLSYYDTMGRTWERQALIKVRAAAGDPALGKGFVRAIEPFVYRKYMSFAEINEVKALKRRMEYQATRAGTDDQDVKTGCGGIRDIEYTVQFLQLLNGGDLPAVRQRNTLLALEALEIAGCLTAQETYILSDAYRFLRKTEHRLQLLFDLQTHRLPASAEELRKLALRMGYSHRSQESGVRIQESKDLATAPPLAPDSRLLTPQKRSPLDESGPPPLDTRDLLLDPLDQFLKDLADKTTVNRTILNHLLHQTFPDSGGAAAEPESDLVLAPDPDEATVKAVLGKYPFRDAAAAYQNLMGLARESVPFLSARRCRHFLASIAPPLLRAVADTPDPDAALTNLERVSASLGAKAVLWELFSVNPPTLKLYVDLCAGSPFLSGLLINNPGMIDELLDSLVLNQPRTLDELRLELAELCRGASDTDTILHSFQDKELLRIVVGDLLGKADVRQTTAALSDLAEAVLNQVFDLQGPVVRGRFGVPRCPKSASPRSQVEGGVPDLRPADLGLETVPCRYAVLGMGKLGGREISYHSDLDLLLIYEGEGATEPAPGATGRFEPTTNAHYFTELAQHAIRALSRAGPMGRLYEVDMRLRPTGKSGSLVLSLAEFTRYYAGGAAQLWERQALTRGRVVRGDPAFASGVAAAARAATLGRAWCPALVDDIRGMREKMEAASPTRSLKRGPGGLADVEFLVQLLQLKYGTACPAVLRPNVWDALDAAEGCGLLAPADAAALREGYSFLRLVEARLRVVADRPLNDLPDAADDRAKLARRLGFAADGSGRPASDRFLAELKRVTTQVRKLYAALTRKERS